MIQSGASKDAASQAAGASTAATNAQLQMFNTQNAQQAPYRQAGYNALNSIGVGLGLQKNAVGAPRPEQFTRNGGELNPEEYQAALANWNASQAGASTTPDAGYGYFAHQFDANDLTTNLAPNYAFQLAQGQGAIKNAGNLQTGLISGNTLKGIEDYTQNYAAGAYQNAFNNYTANQSNIFNRLSTVAGYGSAANTQSSNLAGALAPSIASSITNTGAAQAAGTIGSANALAGGASNALGWYQASKFMQPQTGASGLNTGFTEN